MLNFMSLVYISIIYHEDTLKKIFMDGQTDRRTNR